MTGKIRKKKGGETQPNLHSHSAADLEESKCLVLIGSHIGENVFISQVTNFITGLQRGAKLIVVDPRFAGSHPIDDMGSGQSPAGKLDCPNELVLCVHADHADPIRL